MLQKLKSLGNAFYWLLVFILGGLLALLMITVSKGFSFVKWIGSLRGSSQKEVKEITAARDEELEKKKKAEELYQRRMKAIEEDHVEAKKEFDEKKKAEVETLLKSTENDPQKLAEELAKVTGFKIVLPED